MIDEQNPPHEYSGDVSSYEQYSTEDVLNQETEVGSPARKSMMLIVIFAVVGGMILYNTFSGEEEEKEEVQHQETIVVANRSTLPIATVRITPPAPPAPIPLPRVKRPSRNTKKDVFFLEDAEPSESAREDRLESKMMIMDKQGNGFFSSRGGNGSNFPDNDPNASFANATYRNSEVNGAVATRIGNLGYTIAQGKVVDATLETAVNTDMPGTLRAIVSRDIYAEQGKNILIPKGSRLIGKYNSGISRGQRRVFIIWTRAIRPDGVDIMINSTGIDDLGRAGVAGIVDDKYFEIFSGAILTSLITLGVGLAAEEALGADAEVSSYMTDGGTQVTEGSPGAMAAMAAIGTLGGAGKTIVDSIMGIQPTIYIHQGTSLKVFVNRDLSFPSSMNSNEVMFIN